MDIKPKELLLRLEEVVNSVKNLEQLPKDQILYKPAPEKWSVVEIVQHMNEAYLVYKDRITGLIEKLPDEQNPPSVYHPRLMSKWFINMMKPKGEHIPWKMKTMGIFEPKEDASNDEEINSVFRDFYKLQEHFKNAIEHIDRKQVNKGKLVSGIGPLVKFRLHECLEFHMVHQERHIVQARKTVNMAA